MALCKRVVRFGANTLAQVTALSAQGGANSGGYFPTKFFKLNSFSSLPSNRAFNGNPRHARLIDTLALERALEAKGVPSIDANSVTYAIAKLVNDTLEKNVANRDFNGNPRHARLIDTLALARALEAEGVPSIDANAVTNGIAKFLNDTLEKNVAKSSSSKAEIQKEYSSSKLHGEIEKVSDGIDKLSHSITVGLKAAEKELIKLFLAAAVFVFAVGVAVGCIERKDRVIDN